MKTLVELREGLDSIDDQIVKLLHQRADIALEVKRTKEKEKLDIYSPARERQILNRVLNLVPEGHFPRSSLEKIFLSMLSASRSLMGELCVSYVGPESSLGREAALKQFGDNLKFSPESSIEEVFAKVEEGDSQYGIVPARTTSGNTTTKTYDLLTQSSLVIIAEVEIKEKFSLIGAGSGLSAIKQVYADANTFNRCMSWIKSNLATAELRIVDNTDIAVKVAKDNHNIAAIALDGEAERSDLVVIASGIESESQNDARFFILGQKPPPQTGHDKTSLLCAVSEKSGALRDILQPFSEYKITLLKIESRSIRTRGEEYGFYIDAFGHQQEPALQAALFKLNSLCSFVKVFGSYPLVYHS